MSTDRVADELESIDRVAELTESVQSLERQLAETARDLDILRTAVRRKDEFLALLAHELRNPLAPLLSAIQLMDLSPDDLAQQTNLRQIMARQVEQLMRLTDDLRDISRITRGKFSLEKKPLELGGAIETACDLARPLLEEAGHQFTRTFSGTRLVVLGDKVRLAQVIGNLLINAAKYTPPGGQVALLVRPDGDHAEIRVRDNGVGIPPEMLPRIFDMFMQVNESKVRSQGGLGIGLALAKRLVEMHEGAISVTSGGEGAGSEFVVRLPLHHHPELLTSGPLAVPESRKPLPARNILVVDDNVAPAHLLGRLLQKLGQHADTASSAAAALEFLEKTRADIVISDIGMPEMSGYDLAREIRARPELRQVILIAVTGFGDESDREQALEAGFDFFLTKPVGIQGLEELLSSISEARTSETRQIH
jgi:CheY-like chemotaxis protein